MTNAASPAELNRAIDASANDWILVIREHEAIDVALAGEVVRALDGAAWGYRVRTTVLYAGKPLRIGDSGELRLFHRRHRRRDGSVEGPVIRIQTPLRAISFASTADHRAYLEKNAVPHSALRRTLIFLRNARTFDRNTLRYLWLEAGYDHGGR